MAAGENRYEIGFGRLRGLLTVLGCGPRASRVTLGPEEVRVRMGWAFRAVIPRSAVTAVRRDRDMRWGIGVHGWNGRWLVNGTSRHIVTIEIDPPARARVCGVRVHLRRLHVSLADPDRFVEAATPPGRTGR